ncbi:hypothetical protein BCF11_1185 [Collimonas sp. PA-H2]|uniref:hypothetical protein n=1 Tax=Collimonas sp. PA-H2 TaxID=1881062 RepID=UPI000C00E1D2|nr:hypothetical protein [Collimonas sp. PA-H2]PFH08810.1 hypothetical protein BCF11_1185 [Collimonas sp. PA-H2]
MVKKETSITLANGDMHSQKAHLKAEEMLTECKYLQSRLYHLIMMGSERKDEYQACLKALCFELRRKNIPCEWRGCVEVDETRGLHYHAFILVEAKHRNPCTILNHKGQGWLNVMMQKRGLTYYIAPPKSAIHQTRPDRELNYASLAGEKLADCLIWISYLVKNRSKPTDITYIYSGSRERKSGSKQSGLRKPPINKRVEFGNYSLLA